MLVTVYYEISHFIDAAKCLCISWTVMNQFPKIANFSISLLHSSLLVEIIIWAQYKPITTIYCGQSYSINFEIAYIFTYYMVFYFWKHICLSVYTYVMSAVFSVVIVLRWEIHSSFGFKTSSPTVAEENIPERCCYWWWIFWPTCGMSIAEATVYFDNFDSSLFIYWLNFYVFQCTYKSI